MGKVFDHISEQLQIFIQEQHIFFVATAPLAEEGHLNLSPKGVDSFRILSPNQVGYIDLVGSGNETSAHLLENGRIIFMFCAFSGAPNVVRLYGKGRTILPNTDEWERYCSHFPAFMNTRQIIIADIDRVSTACGFAVPLMDFVEERDQHTRWAEAKTPQGLVEYQKEKNTASIDGLPTPLATCFTE